MATKKTIESGVSLQLNLFQDEAVVEPSTHWTAQQDEASASKPLSELLELLGQASSHKLSRTFAK
jgi:hypothetical protein